MSHPKNLILTLLCTLLLHLSGNIHAQNTLPREFRGVWVATVHNIDWPKQPTLTTAEQKESLIELLDGYKALNLNAVVFQIRPAADAFYPSKLEPWSAWLTDEQGTPPNPYYDPLQFAIDETHKRGMEFHAWLNPYRASSRVPIEEISKDHVIHTHPEWTLTYGENIYLDPGIPEVRAYTNAVVHDIVSRYDVDAIHFDDYFYPYKINGELFPDDNSFKNYGKDFYPNHLEDWRRQNVDQIIQELGATIKKAKPWVQFGISPFGVWRNADVDPTGSKTQASQTNYDDLYADIKGWVEKGWIDYVVPQAYWHIGFEIADYVEITNWWNQNSPNTNLYIGQSVSRLNSDRAPEWKAFPKTEIEKQLDINKTLSEVKGSVFFNGSTFLKNPLNITERLQKYYYTHPILPPVIYPSIKDKPKSPKQPRLEQKKDNTWLLSWKATPDRPDNESVKYIVYRFDDTKIPDFNAIENILSLTGNKSLKLPAKQESSTLAIVAVNRNNRCSEPLLLNW